MMPRRRICPRRYMSDRSSRRRTGTFLPPIRARSWLEFEPENGNVFAADQGTFLARIRDYGNYVAVFDPQLKVGVDATGKLTITWATGTLVSSPTVPGSYGPVQNATSPYVVTPTGGAMFYRVQQ